LNNSKTHLDRTLRRYAALGVLAVLLLVAFALRTYSLDWDRGHYFHPDERQILMVASGLSWPRDPLLFLSPSSPLNPHFFAYGSLPIYLLRALSSLAGRWGWDWALANNSILLGRLLSALFDTLTVLASYLLGRKVFDRRVGLLGALCVTFTVLHIQLAHFYTVDTLLTTLILLAVNKAVDVARRGRRRDGAWLGVLLGMALATKLSVLPLTAVAVVAWLAFAWPSGTNHPRPDLRTLWVRARSGILLTFAMAALCFVALQPYALIDAYSFAVGIGQEIAMAQGWYDFPYTRQYAGTWPYVYQVRQILLFGMGVPLGLLGLSGLLWLCWRVWRRPRREEAVLLTWPALYALMQGAAYAKFIRYTLPLVPFLCVAGAATWVRIWDAAGQGQGRESPAEPGQGLKSLAEDEKCPPQSCRTETGQALGQGLQVCGGRASVSSTRWPKPCQSAFRWLWLAVLFIVVLSTVVYACAFLNVYRQPHPWLQATAWLCEHAPAGSTILTEYWDDPLPLGGATELGGCPLPYSLVTVDFHTLDTEARLEELLDAIQSSDYIVLSSQRLYGALPRSPQYFPLATRYYQQLFAERLGFRLVAAPAVYPQWAGVTLLDNPRAGLPLPIPPLLAASRPSGWVIDLGQADESFSVYDHPQPLIFARVERLSREELQSRIALKNTQGN
jgi:hypothetical protein